MISTFKFLNISVRRLISMSFEREAADLIP